jgi:hypothetical protein
MAFNITRAGGSNLATYVPLSAWLKTIWSFENILQKPQNILS